MSPLSRAGEVPGIRKGVAAPGAKLAAAAEPAPEPVARQGGPRPRPPKPVRFTLDLQPDLHRFLKEFALRAEADASVVMRVLLGQLRTDADLARRVQAEIWEQ